MRARDSDLLVSVSSAEIEGSWVEASLSYAAKPQQDIRRVKTFQYYFREWLNSLTAKGRIESIQHIDDKLVPSLKAFLFFPLQIDLVVAKLPTVSASSLLVKKHTQNIHFRAAVKGWPREHIKSPYELLSGNKYICLLLGPRRVLRKPGKMWQGMTVIEKKHVS